MLNRRMLPRITMLLALLALPAGARAQDGDVPRELVLALLDEWGGSRVQILEGQAPDSFPGDALPSGARVLGSLVRGRSSTVVAAVAQEPAAALAAWRERLRAAGWRSPVQQYPEGGFVPASGAPHGDVFCRDDKAYLMASASARSEGGSHLRMHFAAGERYGPCNTPQGAQVFPSPEFPRPTLRLPPGAMMHEAGSSSGSEYRDEHARIAASGLDVGAAAAHFAAQLRQQGWTLREPVVADQFVVQAGVLRDEKGRKWLGLLTAMPSQQEGELEVSFRTVGPREEQ